MTTALQVRHSKISSRVVACILAVGVSLTFGSAYAQSEPRPATINPANDLVSGFFSRIGSEGAGLLLNQLGLDTAANQMDAIVSQLNAIQGQITQLQSSIYELSGQITQAEYTKRIEKMNEYIADLHSVYRDEFLPLSQKVAAVARAKDDLAKAPPDKKADFVLRLTAALGEYAKAERGFSNRAVVFGPAMEKLHFLVFPGNGATSIINAYGDVQYSRNRYLTSAHSKRVRALYDEIEQYEALAAWMKAEYVAGVQKGSVARVGDEFTGYREKEAKVLPPALPDCIVLDRGPDSTSVSFTTIGKTMFLDEGNADITWPGDPQAYPTPALMGDYVNGVNQSRARSKETCGTTLWDQPNNRGFRDWNPPSRTQIESLLANFQSFRAKNPAAVVTTYLRAVGFKDVPDRIEWGKSPHLWVSDQESVWTCNKQVPVHTGFSTADGAWDYRPAAWEFPPEYARLCDEKTLAKFGETYGSVILQRRATVDYF